jgi:hypothetical protein
MHQNTFLSTPYIKKYLFKKIDSSGLEVCANAAKHVFFTTSDVKKYVSKELDSGCQEICANASKHVYYQIKL